MTSEKKIKQLEKRIADLEENSLQEKAKWKEMASAEIKKMDWECYEQTRIVKDILTLIDKL